MHRHGDGSQLFTLVAQALAVQRLGRGVRRGDVEHRVAIGRCARHHLDGHPRAGARLVLHHDLLTQFLGKVFAQHTGGEVARTPGTVG